MPNKVKALAQDHQARLGLTLRPMEPEPMLLTSPTPSIVQDLGSSLDCTTHQLCVFL